MTIRSKTKRKAVMWFSPETARDIVNEKRQCILCKKVWKKDNIGTVLIYVGEPFCQIVGDFDVTKVHRALPPFLLWDMIQDKVTETMDEFYEYFGFFPYANAIEIGMVRQFEKPITLDDIGLKKPPLTFFYVKDHNYSVYVNNDMKNTHLSRRQAYQLVREYKELYPDDNVWFDVDDN